MGKIFKPSYSRLLKKKPWTRQKNLPDFVKYKTKKPFDNIEQYL